MRDSVIFVVLLIMSFTIPVHGFAQSPSSRQMPYKRMLDDSNSFTGVEDNSRYQDAKHITIGLFMHASPQDKVGSAILEAASSVIAAANKKGGFNGIPFKLVHRWTETPWSAGPGEILQLIQEDKAIAIVTSFSAESHIAAQIAVKLLIPVISVASSDATLTQARVPWIFRLPPDDKSQASILLKACIAREKCQAGLISTTDQDSRIGANAIIDEFAKQSNSLLFHFQVNQKKNDWEFLITKITRLAPETLFLRTTHPMVTRITTLLKNSNFIRPLFITWTPGLDIQKVAAEYPGRIYLISPIEDSSSVQATQHSLPIYFLAFDGVQMAVQAVISNGVDRAAVRQNLAETKEYIGITGKFIFDTGGGNISPPTLHVYN